MGLKIDQRLLTEEERKLQEVTHKILTQGGNAQLEEEFKIAWNNAVNKLEKDNPFKTYGEIMRGLDYLCQQEQGK